MGSLPALFTACMHQRMQCMAILLTIGPALALRKLSSDLTKRGIMPGYPWYFFVVSLECRVGLV